MKQWAAVFVTLLILLWIALIALVSKPANANEAKEQALCVTEKFMAQSIQIFRISQRPTLAEYQEEIEKRANFGKPTGQAKTPEQIAIKDKFWRKNIKMAAKVYELPVGWSPEYVGNFMLKVCQWEFQINRLREEGVQKYDV